MGWVQVIPNVTFGHVTPL